MIMWNYAVLAWFDLSWLVWDSFKNKPIIAITLLDDVYDFKSIDTLTVFSELPENLLIFLEIVSTKIYVF